MRVLAIDCASEAASVALFEANGHKTGVLIAGDWRLLGRGHAEALVPMIAALPDRGRAARIAVGLGPGSFTGVRIAIAAARALGLAWGATVVGFPTLALVAAMAAAQYPGEELLVAAPAGHGELFVQPFDATGKCGVLRCLSPAAALVGAAERIVGIAAEALVALRGSGRALAIYPDARQFSLLSADALTLDLAPIYGRAPDARLPGAAYPPR